jgi:hypothetical protein
MFFIVHACYNSILLRHLFHYSLNIIVVVHKLYHGKNVSFFPSPRTCTSLLCTVSKIFIFQALLLLMYCMRRWQRQGWVVLATLSLFNAAVRTVNALTIFCPAVLHTHHFPTGLATVQRMLATIPQHYICLLLVL